MSDDLAGETPESEPESLLRFRAGAPYHPLANDECDRLVVTFTVRLESMSAQIAQSDGMKAVDPMHVRRAYDTMVAPRRRRRLVALFGSALFGAAISAAVGFFVAFAQAASGPMPAWVGWGLGASFLIAVVSGIAVAIVEK